MPNHLTSIRVGHNVGEWLHEYLFDDIVTELNYCCTYDLIPAEKYDLLYGTSDTGEGQRLLGIYKILGPYMREVWEQVGKMGSLPLGVEDVFKKKFGESSGVHWNCIRSYKAIKGRECL